ncbi:MAG: DUF3999 family protein [Lysobacterales bacterium]
MRGFAGLVALLLWPALTCAQPQAERNHPADHFALQLPLQVSGANGVVQLTLPLAVYQASRQPGLADLRIYNDAGQALPYHLDLPGARSEQSASERSATLFPSLQAGAEDPRQAAPVVDLQVRADGSLHWRSDAPRSAPDRLVELIVDLGSSGADERLDSLRFEAPADTPTYRALLQIERSDDLRWWETVAVEQLDWLDAADGSRLQNDRIDLPSGQGRYLRLRWRDGQPRLFAAIHGRWVSTALAPVSRLQLQLDAQPGAQAGDSLYRSSPAISATAIGLVLPEQNLVLPVRIGEYARRGARPADPVRLQVWLQTTAWRLLRDGQERQSGLVQIAPRASEQWVVRTDPGLPAPALLLQWQPQRLIFTARGQGFRLAVGASREMLRDLPGGPVPLSQVAPGGSTGDLDGLEQAQLGHPVSGPPVPSPAAVSAETDRRPWVLWAVLGLGVLLLAGLSWRLYRQLGDPAATEGRGDH